MSPASFQSFSELLGRLVEVFDRNFAHYSSATYDEASLRQEFLNPFFRALGWDIENTKGYIPTRRDVEVESRTIIQGRKKRADYLFRTNAKDRFVCEAKKPAEKLDARHAFQAKRYAWNMGLPLSVLMDFEEIKIYVVGSKAKKDEPTVGLWKTWHFREFPAVAQELWDLLAYERVAGGSIYTLIESLPKKPVGKGKARQQWLYKPDRSRALDADFLNFLDEARRKLAGDLLQNNDRADLLEGTKLNDAVQRIIDRILFLRICEDRDIETGTPLFDIVRTWQRSQGIEPEPQPHYLIACDAPPSHSGSGGLRAERGSLWHSLVHHFRALDRRPPSHVPFFNGNLFKFHLCEELIVGDAWLADFITDLSKEESDYLFSIMKVEILGTIYERFLGKIVRPHGRGVMIEEKPEVRKAGGVYYTPRYIVEYIVEQTVGKLLEGRTPEQSLELKILDPACGSGSFLLRAFERVCEHWQRWFMDKPKTRKPEWCWVNEQTGDVHLTAALKRRILVSTIYGVDIDAGAVEVTQLSLYLKMLQDEDRNTMQRERELFPSADALLPPLYDNIKCGNSLIASDFSMVPHELVSVNAFDWDVQFKQIMKAGGFDAVIGNPPYGRLLTATGEAYLAIKFPGHTSVLDVYVAFMLKARALLKPHGRYSYIVPSAWLGGVAYRSVRNEMLASAIRTIICLPYDVFADAYIDTCIFVVENASATSDGHALCYTYPKKTRLDSIVFPDPERHYIPCQVWRDTKDLKFVLSWGAAQMVKRLSDSVKITIRDCAEMKRGVLFDAKLLTAKRTGPASQPYFEGDVYRYAVNITTPSWVEYGHKMREWPKEFKWFEGARILMRRLVNRQQRLMSVCVEDTFITNKNLYSIRLRDDADSTEHSLHALLAVLNSRLLSRLYLAQVSQATKDDFPQVTIADIMALPMPKLSKGATDRLASLSIKMTSLMPQLRAAKTEQERQVLQNAVAATDRQIDQLVYELYGLTDEEIAIVEGADSAR